MQAGADQALKKAGASARPRAGRSRFQHLWEHAARKKQANEMLEAGLEDLLDRIEREIRPAEQKMGGALLEMMDRLLMFSTRKSLSQWQRVELDSWIHETLMELQALGLVDRELHNRMAEMHARDLGLTLDDDSELSSSEQLEKYLANVISQHGIGNDDEHRFDDDFTEADKAHHEPGHIEDLFAELFDFGNEEGKTGSASSSAGEKGSARAGFEEFFEQFDTAGELDGSKDVRLNSTAFKTLFRRTARALHPDKERDADKRAEKQGLMAALLEARRNNDLITIMEMYNRYAAVREDLEAADCTELEGVLELYLKQQESREYEIINRSPLHAEAYDRFYAKTSKIIDRRLAQHLAKIEDRKAGLELFAEKVKTLKVLKPVLEERYDLHDFRREPW